jgi:hypothetical protein
MKTTIEIVGYPELVLERAVDLGIARSKTDAVRMGVLALNQVYHLLDGEEGKLVARKIREMEARNRKDGKKPETERDVVHKYPHLRAISP